MGFGDIFFSLADSAKNYKPDPTLVKNACQSYYDYGLSAISKVDNVVSEASNVVQNVIGSRLPDNGTYAKIEEKLNGYLPDEEGRAEIGHFAMKFAKIATVLAFHEGVKFVPGGSFIHKTYLQTLPDQNTGNLKETVKALQAEVKALQAQMEKERNGSGEPRNPAETMNFPLRLNSRVTSCLNLNANYQKKPVDVLSVGGRINQHTVDHLVVPAVLETIKPGNQV